MGPSDDPVLSIRDLAIRLPPGGDRDYAVYGASLDVRRDEVLCLVGESGSGKSLTASAVMGLLPAPRVHVEAGRILFEGRDLVRLAEPEMRTIRGARIAMVFQEPMTALNPLQTIGSQIEEVLKIHTDLPRAARRERVLDLLAEVRLEDPRRIAEAYPHQASGGERQRAMIAMALILGPRLLIADEPTTALDVTTQAHLLALLRTLRARHDMAVLFITHDFGVVADIADRVAVMHAGRIVETGPAEAVLSRPEHSYTRALIAAVPSLTPRPAKRLPAGAPVKLAVRGLVKAYRTGGGLMHAFGRRVEALRGVDLELRRGETLGLVGESGSGKTTLARCVMRLIEADAGEVLIDGADFRRLGQGALRRERHRMQMVFQDPFGALNPKRRIGDLVAQGPLAHGATRVQAEAQARRMLALVGVDPAAGFDRYPHEFSGGQRQRIGIARALALEPEILIADEPVSSLDVSVQAQVLHLLADIRERFGLTMLFVTHDLRVAAQVCDRVAVMWRGEVVEAGATAELFAAPRHPYTRELLGSVPGRGRFPPASATTT